MKKASVLIVLLTFVLAFGQDNKDKKNNNDHWAGTWKLDLSKSKLHPPSPKDETVKVESSDLDTIKYTTTGTDAEGKQFTENFDGKADGKSYPLTINGEEMGQITYKRLSDHRYASRASMHDGTTSTGVVTLSKDNKKITITEHVKTPKGDFDETIIFTKQ
jgi:hypothetical protein